MNFLASKPMKMKNKFRLKSILIIEGAVTAWKAYFSLSQSQEFN